MPLPSWPRPVGLGNPGLRSWCTWEWQTPLAKLRTVTRFGPGSGMSIYSTTNGPPYSTCMAALLFTTVCFDRSSRCPYVSQCLAGLQYVNGLGELAGAPGQRRSLRRQARTTRACCPGFSFRRHDPIDFRWRRMTPETKVRVRDDSGSAARQKSTGALAAVKRSWPIASLTRGFRSYGATSDQNTSTSKWPVDGSGSP
jgi:hypothetical protein